MTRPVLQGLLGLAVLGGGGAACTDTLAPIEGTQSLRVTLVAPSDTGDVDNRLPDTAHTVSVSLEALDEQGRVDTSFSEPVRVYAQFLGTLTPALSGQPIATIQVDSGVASSTTFELPDTVLGPTTLWIDNGTGFGTDYRQGAVTGTSNTLWFRDPLIVDLQRPRNEAGVDALIASPLQDKQVNVASSRYGDRGRLVVTSVFAQGYTVSDVQCADAAGTPPCAAQAYDHMLIFTFSAARDQAGNLLRVGQVIERFTGGVTEFNGLTEIGFPRTYAPAELVVNPARLPAPVLFDQAWFGSLGTETGVINFERHEGGPIAIEGGIVCPFDQDYATYKQWKIDPSGMGGAACNGRNLINLITTGTDFTTDPATLVGRRIPRLVGILRPVNIGSFNVWIIFPRGTADFSL